MADRSAVVETLVNKSGTNLVRGDFGSRIRGFGFRKSEADGLAIVPGPACGTRRSDRSFRGPSRTASEADRHTNLVRGSEPDGRWNFGLAIANCRCSLT